MSTYGFTIPIDPNSYLGDSLTTINSNMSSLDTNSCDSLNLISYLSGQIVLMDNTILATNTILNNMALSKNAGTLFYLVTTTGTLLTTISSQSLSNSNYDIGTFTIPSLIYNDITKIPANATLLLLSGYPVGCSNINGSLLFTIEGIPINNILMQFTKTNTYNYSWHYTNNCIHQQYKIFLMGYI